MKSANSLSSQKNSHTSEVLNLRLYVAGKSPNSVHALNNLRAICQELLADDSWQLEVVDIFSNPKRALEDKILVTPTLLKLGTPDVRIVGDLSQRERVLAALDLVRYEE
jgi:circadian clock protein KaiB